MIKNDKFWAINGDCIKEISQLEDNSVHFSIFSPPFVDLYVYSDSIEDLGNSKDYNEFFTHFTFLTDELYRVLKPGRLVAVHCMDLPIQKGKEGYIGLRDFPGMLIKTFEKSKFISHDRITIWKDPVTEMQRTKALGLLHKQIKKDSTMCRTGLPDYLVVFRKPGQNTEPVTHQDKDPTREDYFPVDQWQKWASPIWMNINYSDTLHFREARDDKDEKHLCPLQLPTIERAIALWTNKRDIVFTPFMGVGSEVYMAVKMGRYGIGVELKESYFNQGIKNLNSLLEQQKQLTLL